MKVAKFKTTLIWDSTKHSKEENVAILGFDPGENNKKASKSVVTKVDKKNKTITIKGI